MKPLGILAGASLVLAACAGQQAEAPLTVAEISVETDLSAVGSREAAAYWRSLDADLETALAEEFVGQIDPGGRRVVVDVDEITLADALEADLAAEDARLAGRVALIDPEFGETVAAYDVTATSRDAAQYLPSDTDVVQLSPSSEEYYQAVVQAFARGAAEALRAGT